MGSEKLEERIERLEKKIESLEVKDSEDEKDRDPDVSRRGFLKGAVGGFAGISAAAMLPTASAFDIESDSPLRFIDSSSDSNLLEVDGSGNLDVSSIGSGSSPLTSIHTEDLDTEKVFYSGLSSEPSVPSGEVALYIDGSDDKLYRKPSGGSPTRVGGSSGNHLDVKTVSNRVYAKEFSGSGLASKVENALDYLQNNHGGQGRVTVTAKDDGSSWTWDKDLVLNTEDRGGVDIEVGDNVDIDYPGSGVALKATTNGSAGAGSSLRLVGGNWRASSDAEGWCVIEDVPECHIAPRTVNFTNGTNDCFGLKVRNVQKFTEEGTYGPGRITADDCVVFEPASVTGGSGTESFHGTKVDNLTLQAKNRCLVLAGDFRWSMFEATCQTKADNVDQVILEGSADNKDFTGCWMKFKNEDAGSHSNTTAYVAGSNYNGFYPPKLEQYEEGISIENTSRVDGAGNAALPTTRTRGNGLWFEDLFSSNSYFRLDLNADTIMNSVNKTTFGRNGNLEIKEASEGFFGEINFTGGGSFNLQHGGNARVKISSGGVERMEWQQKDLSNLSPGSSEDGNFYAHNGSSTIDADGGTTSSKGVYAWSSSDGEWKSVVNY